MPIPGRWLTMAVLLATVASAAAAVRVKGLMRDWKADMATAEQMVAGRGAIDAAEMTRILNGFASDAGDVASHLPTSSAAADLKARFDKFAAIANAAVAELQTKDRLKQSAYGMSGGQQQRLCIARALATDPDVILMDEPCSALDPISTARIEDLLLELRKSYAIVIVTHNMQQAARVSDSTAFFTVELDEGERHRTGRIVEFDATEKIFQNPGDPRTEAYVTGKVG